VAASLPVGDAIAESLSLPVLRLVADRSGLRERTQVEPMARQLGIWWRVRDCGRLVAGERGGLTVIEPRRCKARGCPACDRSRAWRQGRDLARHATRIGGVLVLATLVRTGSPHESAFEAVGATMGALRRVSASRASRRARAAGASVWRAVELVTNDLGWHCHVHALVHGATEAIALAGARELAGAWSSAAETPIERQLVERVRDVARACAYVTKTIEIGACAALRGRKLWAGAGAWSGWSRTGEGRGRVENERAPSQLELEAWAAARGVAARAATPEPSREYSGDASPVASSSARHVSSEVLRDTVEPSPWPGRDAVDRAGETRQIQAMGHDVNAHGRVRSAVDLAFGLVFFPIVLVLALVIVLLSGLDRGMIELLGDVWRDCGRLLRWSARGIVFGRSRGSP
jgi:hypothetical protein